MTNEVQAGFSLPLSLAAIMCCPVPLNTLYMTTKGLVLLVLSTLATRTPCKRSPTPSPPFQYS